jgi:hypothetical protein
MKINAHKLGTVNHCLHLTTHSWRYLNENLGEWNEPIIIFHICLYVCNISKATDRILIKFHAKDFCLQFGKHSKFC